MNSHTINDLWRKIKNNHLQNKNNNVYFLKALKNKSILVTAFRKLAATKVTFYGLVPHSHATIFACEMLRVASVITIMNDCVVPYQRGDYFNRFVVCHAGYVLNTSVNQHLAVQPYFSVESLHKLEHHVEVLTRVNDVFERSLAVSTK